MLPYRILVTGGAGFVGSNFIRHMLSKHEYKIVNLDKLTYAGNLESLRDVENDERYSFVEGDICNYSLVDILVRDVDVVINFAAESHVDRSIKDPTSFLKTDILGTQNLLSAVKKHNVKRFIQISTDEVYGSIEKGSSVESDPLLPNNPYSASKASADLMCRAYFETYGTPVVITRSTNNFGKYQHIEKLIPYLCDTLLKDEQIYIYGDGTDVRDWIYVEDNCKAIDMVLHKGKVGQIYNIGGSNEVRNIDMANNVCRLLGKGEVKFTQNRQGHDKRYSLNSSKLYALGYKPNTDFVEALKETVNWYRDNEWRKSCK